MQAELTKAQPLLDENGLKAEGWSRSFLLPYNKIDCTANTARFKEWDRYTVTTPECAITLSIADMGNLGFVYASLTEFIKKPPGVSSQTITKAYPMGRMGMPLSTKSGDTTYTSSQVGMKFSRTAGVRYLKCEFVNFCDGKTLYLNLALKEPDRCGIACASSFPGKKGCFQYRYRVSLMPAEGVLRFGGAEYRFSPQNSYGTLSWNRGVLPLSRVEESAVTLCGIIKSEPFVLLLGSELENCLYYKESFHKLSGIRVIPPQNDEALFQIQSSDSKFQLEMEPLAQNEIKAGFLLNSCRHQQVFAKFHGQLPLEGEEPITFRNFIGFAERFESRL